jgi:hypothetical protein
VKGETQQQEKTMLSLIVSSSALDCQLNERQRRRSLSSLHSQPYQVELLGFKGIKHFFFEV